MLSNPARKAIQCGSEPPPTQHKNVRHIINALGSCLGCGRHETADPAMGAGS